MAISPAEAMSKRVAVGHGGRGELRADHAVRAGLVIDHEGLSEQGANMLAKVARQDVDAAAGGMGHDHADRPRRVGVLRERAAAEGDTRADSAEVFYPGEIEARNDARHRTEGLLLSADTMADLKRIAGDCGIACPFSV